MRKFLNSPEHFVDEMVEGLLLAHPDLLRSARKDNRALVRHSAPKKGKVGIITGGGSGHLPLFLGYVGVGLLDGVAIGDVFQSPSPEQILDATRAVNGGAGVLYLYGNYGGDVLNFDMAADLAEMEEITVRTVLGADDVASMPPERAADRRGVAGIFFQYKCAGACAEQGGTLDEVVAAAEKAGRATRSMGVALSACTIPAVGKPGFSIGEGEMEVGMGIHGEPGIERSRLAPADDVARQLVERILADMPIPSGAQTAILVNGLGATPLEELYIISRAVHRLLGERGIKVYRSYVGEYATSMEMAGLSVSIMALDDELRKLVDAPFETPFHKQFASSLE
jgi:dihydroxyacetone kinase